MSVPCGEKERQKRVLIYFVVVGFYGDNDRRDSLKSQLAGEAQDWSKSDPAKASRLHRRAFTQPIVACSKERAWIL